jgi:hypothetical protein
MRKLSRKVRLQKALENAEAHVRKIGTDDLEDWAYTYAVDWGFEEDEDAKGQIKAQMHSTRLLLEAEAKLAKQKADEQAYQEWKIVKAARDAAKKERDELQKEWDEWQALPLPKVALASSTKHILDGVAPIPQWTRMTEEKKEQKEQARKIIEERERGFEERWKAEEEERT